MGRVCSALPGSTVDGMGARHAHHDVPAAGNGAPSHPVPTDPSPEASSLTCGEHPAIARSAPPGAASRGADRRQAAPQRRRAPAPGAGLDYVKKI
jgi:hypothetical protein